eukprot:scaffold246206_cov17-Tisochrysis_lutea.AAC.1
MGFDACHHAASSGGYCSLEKRLICQHLPHAQAAVKEQSVDHHCMQPYALTIAHACNTDHACNTHATNACNKDHSMSQRQAQQTGMQ